MTTHAAAPHETTDQTASDICAEFEPSGPAAALLDSAIAPREYLDRLIQHELLKDSIKFVAYWLPKQEAVWWGCECVWLLCRKSPAKPVNDAISAAVRWVIEPSEATRRAAEQAGKAAGASTPAGSIALAAAWSDGSMSRPGLAAVAPPPLLSAKMVAGGLLSAAAANRSQPASATLMQFLQLAAEVASGKNRWDRPKAS